MKLYDLPICVHCNEPIQEGDAVEFGPLHYECALRGVLGSVGHQRRLCSCYGGTEDDPPGMTARQAARAAVVYHYFGKLPNVLPQQENKQ